MALVSGGFGDGLVAMVAALFGAIAPIATLAATAAAAATVAFFLVVLRVGAGLILDQGLTVRDRDLVVIRMDFGEGQKAVPVPAVVNEGRLERRLHTGHLRQIDVTAKLSLAGCFEVEFFDPITA